MAFRTVLSGIDSRVWSAGRIPPRAESNGNNAPGRMTRGRKRETSEDASISNVEWEKPHPVRTASWRREPGELTL